MSDDVPRGERGRWLPGAKPSPATQFKPGQSGNPGRQYKTKKELRMLARSGLPLAFQRAMEILSDEKGEWRAWLEAGKFLALYGYGTPPKAEATERDDVPTGADAGALTLDELRALARQSIADDAARESDDDDDSDDDPDAPH